MAVEERKLIVHADDFGLTEKVNAGILQAHLNGILTSTSIIASGRAFDEAIDILKKTPTLDCGVHLTLVEECPLLSEQKVPSLVGENNRFWGNAKVFVKKYYSGSISLAEVESELEAQIEKVISRGIRVSHLDGHQHLHMLPGIFKVTKRLARKFQIPAIRIPNERLSSFMWYGAGNKKRLIELLILKVFCMLGGKRDILHPEYFAGFFFGGNLNKSNLSTVLRNLPSRGICELMCHPGLDDPDGDHKHWGYHGADELRAITDHEIAEYIQRKGVELISYRGFVSS